MPNRNLTKHRIYILLLFLILSSCSFRDKPDIQNSIDLSGEWQLYTFDNIDIAEPDYEDSSDKILIPGNWNSILEKNEDLTSTIWIKKKFFIEKEFSKGLNVLSLGMIALSDETYLNGVLIGKEGKIPSGNSPNGYGFAWQKFRNYFIPSSLINYESENTITIRIYSHIINGINGNPMLLTYNNWNQNFRFQDYLATIINISTLSVNSILFLIFLIVMLGSWNRAAIFYSILLITSVTILQLLILDYPEITNGLTRFKINLGLYTSAHYLFMITAQAFFSIRVRYVTPILSFLTAIAGTLIFFSPTSASLIKHCGLFSIMLILLYVIYAFTIFLIATIKDPRRYWYLSIVGVPLLISVFNSQYYLLSSQIYAMSLLDRFHMPVILFGVMLISIFDYKDTQTERDSLTKALLRKTRKLKQVMDTYKEDAKPEPREIVNDLIEYLDENYHETYDRKALANRFSLNEDYMGQVFKKSTGTNITTYLNKRRIEAAKQLIQETDSKIIDIAYHVGFENLTHFYRLFKKQTGITPKEYRFFVINGSTDDE